MSVKYTRHAGVKFENNGTLRRFPGNTIICMVKADTATHRLLTWAHGRLAELKCIEGFSLLPPDSFHMTVMEGVCDQVREAGKWPAEVPMSASLDAVRGYYKKQLSSLPVPNSFSMGFDHIDSGDVVKLDLVPTDAVTKSQIGQYRDALAHATSLRFEGHDRYVFHISLAYMIRELDAAGREELRDTVAVIESRMAREFGTWQTGQPTLCYFDDMFSFVPE